METKIEKQEQNIVKVEIEIEANEAKKEYDMACKHLSQHVNVPGFRKGKAPQKMVEQQLGTDYIKRAALEHLLPKALSEVIEKNDLDVIAEPFVEKFDFEIGQPVKIEAKIELKPEVKMGDYKNLTVEIEEYKIEDNALENELKKIAERYAINKEVTDRKTKNTDIVNIDFEGSVDGELIKGGTAKGYQLDLGNSNFIAGFAEQIVGKELNSEFDINVTFPEEYHEPSLKGKPAVFKIKLNKIMERELPVIDDTLAKKVGPFKDLEALKADIQAYLDATKKNEDDKRYSQKLFDTILDGVEVEIQDSMIKREADQMLEEFKNTVAQRGGKWEDVTAKEGEDKIYNDLKVEAKKRIKNSLVIQEIQKLEKIEVAPKDIEEKIEETARMYGTDAKTLVEHFKGNSSFLYSLTQQVMTQKVMEFLMKNNEVKVK